MNPGSLHFVVCMALVSAAPHSRAVWQSRGGGDTRTTVLWTNDDLEKLHALGVISIVGPSDEKTSTLKTAATPEATPQNLERYTEQATELRAELERRWAQLRQYQQALEDARSLRKMTGGINTLQNNIGITPEAVMNPRTPYTGDPK